MDLMDTEDEHEKQRVAVIQQLQALFPDKSLHFLKDVASALDPHSATPQGQPIPTHQHDEWLQSCAEYILRSDELKDRGKTASSSKRTTSPETSASSDETDTATMVRQVLTMFPDANVDWVKKTVAYTKLRYHDNILDRICNFMFDNPYLCQANATSGAGSISPNEPTSSNQPSTSSEGVGFPQRPVSPASPNRLIIDAELLELGYSSDEDLPSYLSQPTKSAKLMASSESRERPKSLEKSGAAEEGGSMASVPKASMSGDVHENTVTKLISDWLGNSSHTCTALKKPEQPSSTTGAARPGVKRDVRGRAASLATSAHSSTVISVPAPSSDVATHSATNIRSPNCVSSSQQTTTNNSIHLYSDASRHSAPNTSMTTSAAETSTHLPANMSTRTPSAIASTHGTASMNKHTPNTSMYTPASNSSTQGTFNTSIQSSSPSASTHSTRNIRKHTPNTSICAPASCASKHSTSNTSMHTLSASTSTPNTSNPSKHVPKAGTHTPASNASTHGTSNTRIQSLSASTSTHNTLNTSTHSPAAHSSTHTSANINMHNPSGTPMKRADAKNILTDALRSLSPKKRVNLVKKLRCLRSEWAAKKLADELSRRDVERRRTSTESSQTGGSEGTATKKSANNLPLSDQMTCATTSGVTVSERNSHRAHPEPSQKSKRAETTREIGGLVAKKKKTNDAFMFTKSPDASTFASNASWRGQKGHHRKSHSAPGPLNLATATDPSSPESNQSLTSISDPLNTTQASSYIPYNPVSLATSSSRFQDQTTPSMGVPYSRACLKWKRRVKRLSVPSPQKQPTSANFSPRRNPANTPSQTVNRTATEAAIQRHQSALSNTSTNVSPGSSQGALIMNQQHNLEPDIIARLARSAGRTVPMNASPVTQMSSSSHSAGTGTAACNTAPSRATAMIYRSSDLAFSRMASTIVKMTSADRRNVPGQQSNTTITSQKKADNKTMPGQHVSQSPAKARSFMACELPGARRPSLQLFSPSRASPSTSTRRNEDQAPAFIPQTVSPDNQINLGNPPASVGGSRVFSSPGSSHTSKVTPVSCAVVSPGSSHTSKATPVSPAIISPGSSHRSTVTTVSSAIVSPRSSHTSRWEVAPVPPATISPGSSHTSTCEVTPASSCFTSSGSSHTSKMTPVTPVIISPGSSSASRGTPVSPDSSQGDDCIIIDSVSLRTPDSTSSKQVPVIKEDATSSESSLELACEACRVPSGMADMYQCCDGHVICTKCVEKQAKDLLSGQSEIHQSGLVACPCAGCSSNIPRQDLYKALPSIIMDLLDDKLQKEALKALEDKEEFVRCPHCTFAALLDPADKQFDCKNTDCKAVSCRYCKKAWEGHDHDRCGENLPPEIETTERILMESLPSAEADLLPSHWSTQNMDGKTVIREIVQPSSEEWANVRARFCRTIDNAQIKAQIKSIHRVQNVRLWRKFSITRQDMMEDNGSEKLNEKWLFHGTKPEAVENICREGFDWRMCGQNGVAFGEGAYFARDAIYSHNYSSGHAANRRIQAQGFANLLQSGASALSGRTNAAIRRAIQVQQQHILLTRLTARQAARQAGAAPFGPAVAGTSTATSAGTWHPPSAHNYNPPMAGSNTAGPTVPGGGHPPGTILGHTAGTTMGHTSGHNAGATLGHTCHKGTRRHLRFGLSPMHSLGTSGSVNPTGNTSGPPLNPFNPSGVQWLSYPVQQSSSAHPPPAAGLGFSSTALPPQPQQMATRTAEAAGQTFTMFLAKVLAGRYTVGTPSLRKPPVDNSYDDGRLFNSCVNHPRDPSIYVIFDSSQAYPEYIISYTVV